MTEKTYKTVEVVRASRNGVVERVSAEDESTRIRRIYPEDRRELFRALSGIDSHNIPHIEEYDFRNCDTTVIEEDVEGALLSECLLTRRFSAADVLSIAEQLFSALDELHKHNVIHRDIKPDNIILAPSGQIYLIDFGISRIYREDAKRDTSLLGTEGYAAPEQYGFMQTDPRADLYSAGVVIKELCETSEDLKKSPIYKIAQKCADFDPNGRYRSAGEALREIKKIRTRAADFFTFYYRSPSRFSRSGCILF